MTTMSDDLPTVAAFRGIYGQMCAEWCRDDALAEFDRLIAKVYADGMRSVADWIDGGTPRAYGFEHPCAPPGVRTGPDDHEEALMGIADATREAAARVEKEAGL